MICSRTIIMAAAATLRHSSLVYVNSALLKALSKTFISSGNHRLFSLSQNKFTIMASLAPTIKLNNGEQMPVLGLGTWKSKPGEVTNAVTDAIDAGYRHIDCAFIYGNEKEVGEGLKAKIADGVISRSDIFITSKLWNTFHKKESIVKACKKSLQNLGLEYLDLYLIHWPTDFQEGDEVFPRNEKGEVIFGGTDYVETYKGMEECVRLGLTKSIGVSNFNSEQLSRVLEIATIKPVTNQIEVHPYLNQSRLIDFCKDRDIVVTAYSPFGSPDRPGAKPDDPLLLEDPKLKAIADKYKKNIAQVILRYLIQRDTVPIPKSVTTARIKSNFQVFDFKLSPEDMEAIDKLDRNQRVCAFDELRAHRYYPFKIPF